MAKGNFGERLKRERELREVTLEEITQATRIGPRFLEALENEDWAQLPGGVFNRGFVRSVARYLGLDEEAFLAEYDLAHGAQVPPPASQQENRIPSPPRWLPVALGLAFLALLIALLIGGIYGFRYLAARRPQKTAMASATIAVPQPPDQPPGSSVQASNPSSPASASQNQGSRTLDLLVAPSRPTHLRVLADGDPVFDTVIHPGENRHFSASSQFQVTAADSGAVLLELNGQAMPPLGLPGSSGTINLSRQDLRQASSGNSKPRGN
jgi:cytoskeleton protein RodZ